MKSKAERNSEKLQKFKEPQKNSQEYSLNFQQNIYKHILGT